MLSVGLAKPLAEFHYNDCTGYMLSTEGAYATSVLRKYVCSTFFANRMLLLSTRRKDRFCVITDGAGDGFVLGS